MIISFLISLIATSRIPDHDGDDDDKEENDDDDNDYELWWWWSWYDSDDDIRTEIKIKMRHNLNKMNLSVTSPLKWSSPMKGQFLLEDNGPIIINIFRIFAKNEK